MLLQFTLSKVVPAASVLVHVPHEDELDAVLVGAGAAHHRVDLDNERAFENFKNIFHGHFGI